jgi:hypothetical protein
VTILANAFLVGVLQCGVVGLGFSTQMIYCGCQKSTAAGNPDNNCFGFLFRSQLSYHKHIGIR